MKTRIQLEREIDEQSHVCATLFAQGNAAALGGAERKLNDLLEQLEDLAP
jgi:hypothetical protein